MLCEELIANFPRYDTDFRVNDEYSNYSFVVCVTFLPSHYIANIKGYIQTTDRDL
jgi:hypothetical protein